jgi:hypothetical protein
MAWSWAGYSLREHRRPSCNFLLLMVLYGTDSQTPSSHMFCPNSLWDTSLCPPKLTTKQPNLIQFPVCRPWRHTQVYCAVCSGRYWCHVMTGVAGCSVRSVLQVILLFVFSSPLLTPSFLLIPHVICCCTWHPLYWWSVSDSPLTVFLIVALRRTYAASPDSTYTSLIGLLLFSSAINLSRCTYKLLPVIYGTSLRTLDGSQHEGTTVLQNIEN